ncbi:DUF1553 domain-containing protein, partial [Flavihumibacter sp. CACIAM 22H1]|uniref:DUF1553 domain-containing protein n=1 Tax=Flavihumibacter sp. CACIAM 22H1 TaxID=1812911 RepID=UPI000AD8E321
IHDVYIQFERPSKPAEKDDFTITFNWLSFVPAFPGKGQPGYEQAYQRYWKLLTANVPGIPILYPNPANLYRKTHVFERGNRLTLGAEVQPAVPASLVKNMQLKENELPSDRLELANWMTNPRNPLVSRTLVNRLWEQLFGTGLVETLEDMGTQGANPTHRELLDELSWKLVHDYKWSIKKMLKEMVLSATYQQDSRVQPEQLEKDAANKYYARGPRVRLTAEQIRDQHLQVSGKLSSKMYGPGVMPWQPDGIWLSPYNGACWVNSEGEDQYRRAVYTYWKRSSPYPSMMNFDGAQRVVCNARRIRTNTPLQALVTLNDSVYIDLARHFAERMMGGKGEEMERGGKGDEVERAEGGVEEMVKWGWRQLLFKEINKEQLGAMTSLYSKARKEFEANPEQLAEFLGKQEMNAGKNREKIPANKKSPATLAHKGAMIIVANALLNMDEVIVKN